MRVDTLTLPQTNACAPKCNRLGAMIEQAVGMARLAQTCVALGDNS